MRISATSRQATAMQRKRVVAVIFGRPAHDHQKSCFKLGTPGIEINHAAVGAHEEHVVQPHSGAALRLDVIGALVDDPEAHLFQHRNAFRQRQRPRKAPYLQTDAVLVFLNPMMKIDAQRALVGKALDDANIDGRYRRCIGFVETLGESITIMGEQLARLVGGVERAPAPR